jgi:hypothetical protein
MYKKDTQKSRICNYYEKQKEGGESSNLHTILKRSMVPDSTPLEESISLP